MSALATSRPRRWPRRLVRACPRSPRSGPTRSDLFGGDRPTRSPPAEPRPRADERRRRAPPASDAAPPRAGDAATDAEAARSSRGEPGRRPAPERLRHGGGHRGPAARSAASFYLRATHPGRARGVSFGRHLLLRADAGGRLLRRPPHRPGARLRPRPAHLRPDAAELGRPHRSGTTSSRRRIRACSLDQLWLRFDVGRTVVRHRRQAAREVGHLALLEPHRLPQPAAQGSARALRRAHRRHHAQAARALGGQGLELLRHRPARQRRPRQHAGPRRRRGARRGGAGSDGVGGGARAPARPQAPLRPRPLLGPRPHRRLRRGGAQEGLGHAPLPPARGRLHWTTCSDRCRATAACLRT